ncbi:uncharacterized protein LOC141664438 [Apium graveolens]|uniref:uncharacterized protein LOC141664438 n=1 Tax=Apium graveolens TaxID=4045 RepID=UPI003D7A7C19
MLSDQLSDVDQSVSDQRLVIQLINGLSHDYNTVGTIISNTSPLPSFDTTRSMLLREETRRGRHFDNQPLVTHQALVAPTIPHVPNPPIISFNNQRGVNNNLNRNRGKNKGSRNYNRGQPRHMTPQQPRNMAPQQHGFAQWPAPGQWPAPSIWGAPWAMPLCPYPTSSPVYQRSPTPGILSSSLRPQALHTTTSDGISRQFTDLPHAFSAMTMQPPDESWYMDTCASSHMAANPCTFHTISTSSNVPSVYVGNGNHIPVVSSGTAQLSPH